MINKLHFVTLSLLVFFALSSLFPAQLFANDLRTAKLARYLAYKRSPFVHAAPTFVEEADRNNLDYRLLVAISGIESSFGQAHPYGSYNVWGWAAGKIYFRSFEHGITVVSAALKENYIDRGAVTIEQIGRIYCPPCTSKWPGAVRQFMAEIEAVDVSDLTLEPSEAEPSLPLTL